MKALLLTLAVVIGVPILVLYKGRKMRCACGGTFTDGGGYSSLSCDRCGRKLGKR